MNEITKVNEITKAVYDLDFQINTKISLDNVFYKNLNDNILEIHKIYSNIEIFQLRNYLHLVECFNLKFNNIITNEEDYFKFLLSISFFLSFNENLKIPLNEKKNDREGGEINPPFENNDICNIILNFLNFYFIWLEINFNLNIINKKDFTLDVGFLRKSVFMTIYDLENKKIIKLIKIWRNSKSHVHLEPLFAIKNSYYIQCFKEPFNLYKKSNGKLFLYSSHYTSIFSLIKQNNSNFNEPKLNLNSNFINNLLKIKIKIDYDLLTSFFKNKLKENNITEEELYIKYDFYYKELLEQMRNDSIGLRVISRKFSIIIDLVRIYEIIKTRDENFFYVPFFLCFRVRTYFKSDLSVTFYKEFRYCFYGEDYETLNPPFHPLNEKIENILEKFFPLLENIKYRNFSNKPLNVKISVIWILISIAEIEKHKLGSQVKIENFLNQAIAMLNDKNFQLKDPYEQLKFDSLKKILDEINKDVYKKRYVSKDATASCFQHLVKILGCYDASMLKWYNLSSSDTWYDPYTYLLEYFKTICKDDENFLDVEHYFIRKNSKRPSMTFYYGAKKETCFAYFIENIDYADLNNETQEKIKFYFYKFYDFLDSSEILFLNNSKKIIEEVKNNNNCLESFDCFQIDLTYYKTAIKQLKFDHNGRRVPKSLRYLTNEKNDAKMTTSHRANYVQFQDACLMRFIVCNYAIFTIHDCFMTDYLSTTYLIALTNEAMNINFHDLKLTNQKLQIFSIFILL